MLDQVIAGRYRILRELGRGGMGVVYLAHEEDRGREVALKALSARRFTESGLRHFEQEFRTLTSLSHPNLVEVYDLGRVRLEDGGEAPFFTMEFVDGMTLDGHCPPGGSNFDELFRCLAQTGQALAYLHGRELLHQDVKPSNILVAAGEHGPTVKLMDLGLAGRAYQGGGESGSIRGTVAYLAPEVVRGAAVDPRADLYSLGCVAYELVTGRPPFGGTSALGVLRGHLEEEPLPPSSLNGSVSTELERLILSLLAKDPGLRPATADRFLRRLAEVAGGELEVESPEVARHRVLGPGFFGREEELDRLTGMLEETRRGVGRLSLVVGEAGVGKSALLREFQVRCQLEGLDVYIGNCGDPGAIGGLAEAMQRAILARGPLSETVRERHGAALDALFGTESDAPNESGFRLPGAVAAALEELSREAPLVLALEDLQTADETTAALLGHLAGLLAAHGDGSTGTLPVLLVGTYRADELARSSPLFDLLTRGREAGIVEEVFLAPLGPDEAARMLRSMLGTVDLQPLFIERILEETHGNPLYLKELVAMLAEEGHVEPGSETGVDPEVLRDVELPGRVRDLVERRLSRVEPEERALLQAAAVLGGPGIDPDTLAGVTGMKWEHVVRLLLGLHRSGLVGRDEDAGGTPRYRFALPLMATLARESLEQDAARELHQAAVAYLERRGVPRHHSSWAAFAHHAQQAGLPGRAVEAFGRAGELAQLLYADREATELFGHAIELVLKQSQGSASVLCGLYESRGESHARAGDRQRAEEDFRWMLARAEKAGDDALRGRAQFRLGEVLATASRYLEAQEALEIAYEIAARQQDDTVATRTLIGLGRVSAQLAEFEQGLAQLDRAVAGARRAEQPVLEVEAMLAKGMLYRDQGNYRLSLEAFRQAAEQTGGNAPDSIEEAIDEGTALALEIQGKHAEALQAYDRARERARERSNVRTVASLSIHIGSACTKIGDYRRARTELENALTVLRRLGSPEGEIQALQHLAVLQVYRGRFEAAAESADSALRLARRIGKRDLVAASLNLMGRIHLRVGDLDGANTRLEETQRIMRDFESQRGLALFQIDVGDLRRLQGRAEQARQHYQESAFLARKVGDRRLESLSLSRLGEAHLLDANYDRAQVAGRKALQLVEGSGLPREEADALLLRARIELGRPGGDVVRAEMDALSALEQYRTLTEPEQVWQAEHLVARAALRLGRQQEAAERIGRAHRYLEAVRSRLGDRWKSTFIEDPRRAELYDDWQRLGKSEPGAPEPVSLEQAAGGDYARLQQEAAALRRLLEINRTLNSSLDTDQLLERILDAAVELTGAERGFVLLKDGSELTTRRARGASTGDLEGDGLALSRSIARRTMESREPLLSTDAEADERFDSFESIRDLKIRSVLALPLTIKDKVAGAIYLDHRLDRGLFTRAHLELAERLSDQAALALDNASMVERIGDQSRRLERLNRELERTVQAQQNELANAREELSFTRSSFELRYRFEELIGGSQAMQHVYHLIERLAPKKLPVLITGESGTGKELIARAVHAKSGRTGGPFFSVNCAALSSTLLESELFGYRKGAFTGADRDKPGYFELAHGGTLFLDEIGETSPEMQAKLLRSIERGEVMPVGGNAPIRVDARIVSATNRDLEAMIAAGEFREDLFYRINVARIALPPLRDRREDIPLLVDHFLTMEAEEEGRERREMEPAALKVLAGLAWPGNVRELQHRVLRVTALSKRDSITLKDLQRYGDLPAPGKPAAAGQADLESLEELERRQIVLALERSEGNKTRAAQLLGINRATLFRKLKRFGL